MEDFYNLPKTVEDYIKGEYGDTFTPDGSVVPMPRIKFFLDYIVDRTPQGGRALLDVGCASGNMGGILASVRNDLNYIGFDLSLPLLRGARERHGPAMKLVNGNIQNLPFKNNSVQYVLCAGTLLYCPDSASAAEALYRIASRIMMVEILFFPHEEEGATVIQERGQYKNTAYILGYLELNRLIARVLDIHPYRNLCRAPQINWTENWDKTGS